MSQRLMYSTLVVLLLPCTQTVRALVPNSTTDLGDGACLVQQVTKGGPAEAAGLRPGDVLLRPDPADQATMVEQLAKHAIGTQVTLPFERHRERKQVVVTIGDQLAINLRGAALGDASAENTIGDIYLNGFGVAKDSAQALEWYRKAAAQGELAVYFGLGDMYANGFGVPNDHAAAAQRYRKAAEQGYAAAEYDLGMMYAIGDGVPKDTKAAIDWLKKAAEHGDPRAKPTLEKCSSKLYGPQDNSETHSSRGALCPIHSCRARGTIASEPPKDKGLDPGIQTSATIRPLLPEIRVSRRYKRDCDSACLACASKRGL